MLLADQTMLFLDCQTTGASPRQGQLLEVAWSVCNSQGELKAEAALLEQSQPIPRRISLLTGITQDDLAAGRSLTYVAASLKNALAAAHGVCVIHYAQFEKPFLDDLWQKAGLGDTIPAHIICTHAVAKRLFATLPSRGLRGLAGFLGTPLGELKRAASHVAATKVIWSALLAALKTQGITTLSDLDAWLATTAVPRRTKREYPLAPSIRLSLPDTPGVYRMLDRSGQVLYVGKATSLKQRVNSYFRGQKGRDTRHLELLTQVMALDVTICPSATEACLLEADEIKRLRPPYNIALRERERRLRYYSRSLSSAHTERDKDHTLGPFVAGSSLEALSMAALLADGWALNAADAAVLGGIVYGLEDKETWRQGLELFCSQNEIPLPLSPRRLLALGLKLLRNQQDLVTEDEDEEPSGESSQDAFVHTAETVAASLARLCLRGAIQLQRARWLNRLSHCTVAWRAGKKGPWRALHLTNGRVLSAEDVASTVRLKAPLATSNEALNFNLETYDRLRVLHTELKRLAKEGYSVRVYLPHGLILAP